MIYRSANSDCSWTSCTFWRSPPDWAT